MKASLIVYALMVSAVVAAERHTWTDASGRHRVEAEFVEVTRSAEGRPEIVRLRKSDGEIQEVPFEQLSRESKRLATRLLRQQAEPKKHGDRGTKVVKKESRRNASKRTSDQLGRLSDELDHRMVLVKSDPIPQGRPVALAAGENALYVLVRGYAKGLDAVLAIDRQSGKTLSTQTLETAASVGLCRSGGHLWVLGQTPGRFLRQMAPSGKIVGTWPLKTPVPGQYYGLAIVGNCAVFASQVDDQSAIWNYCPADGRITRLCVVPGKIISLAFQDGKLYAYLEHVDVYAKHWLLVFDPSAGEGKGNRSDAMRRLYYGKRPAIGLTADGPNLLSMVRRGKTVEVHSVAVREARNLVMSRPAKRHVELRWPVTGAGRPGQMDLYLACPIDRAFQEVTNLSITPAPQEMCADRDGNQWAHLIVRGAAIRGEITMTFDIITVDTAHTFDRDYVARAADYPPAVLRDGLRETYCFDYSHPVVASVFQRIPAAKTLFDRVIAVRNVVNDALKVIGPSGPESRASDFLAQGVGRCYAHTLAFAALARRSGIPTRAIGGVGLANGFMHTWNEIYVPGIGWMEFDGGNDDSPDGKHTFAHIGNHRGGMFITFEGSYDRENPPAVFAQRSWFVRHRQKSLDKRIKADIKLGAFEIKTTDRAFE